jgi:hypothetical protein
MYGSSERCNGPSGSVKTEFLNHLNVYMLYVRPQCHGEGSQRSVLLFVKVSSSLGDVN